MKTSVLSNLFSKSKVLCTAAGLMFAFSGMAQTYTTKADGNWNNAATWVNGSVPPATIALGRIVNINHDVVFNVSNDLNISGTLNIVGDTLRFPASFDKKTIIQSTGLLNVTNGGFLQSLPDFKCEMEVLGGRIKFENAKVNISKSVIAKAGTRRMYKNSTVAVGEKYEVEGTSGSRTIDTIQNATLEVAAAKSGDYIIKNYVTLWVANATVKVKDGMLKNESNAEIVVLAGAANNYGFILLKTSKDLENNGSWNARVDAHCVGGTIKGNTMADIDLTRPEDCSATAVTPTGAAPELVFSKPVLKSGTANKQGAVYRFASIAQGVDAEIKLKKFSRPDIVMQDIDLANMGWDKAFQPQFGLPGLVQPWQNWYIDFELVFYKAGTNEKQSMAKVDLTALDVDGDGNSISEYAVFQNPSSVIYSTVSYLTNQASGSIGQVFTCPADGIASPLKACHVCGGDGKTGTWNFDECTQCEGSGLLYSHNNLAFGEVSGTSVNGPVENFSNIDTLSTQVMATYQYINADRINFRYGAKSAANSSNGSGIRLNSTWFRQFSMAPPTALPVKLTSFSAMLDNGTAVINWTAANEQNFSHYVVERSTDGKTFTAIATVFSMGASKYAYKDANVTSATGAVYYRLRMVDQTKESSLSQVRVIRFGKAEAALTLSTYPNPAIDLVRISLPAEWQNKAVLLELFTAGGIRVQSQQITNASQTEALQLGSAAKGMYVVKATCEGKTAQQRIIKN